MRRKYKIGDKLISTITGKNVTVTEIGELADNANVTHYIVKVTQEKLLDKFNWWENHWYYEDRFVPLYNLYDKSSIKRKIKELIDQL